MEALRVIEARRRKQRAMQGTTSPLTIPGGWLKPGGATPTFPARYPRHADLSTLQADVLALIRVAPGDLKEASDTLGIGEWSRCRQALDQLTNRGLTEEFKNGLTTLWRASS